MKINIILLLSISLFSSNSFAGNGWYLGLGLGFVEFDDSVDTLSPTNLVLKGGYEFNKYIDLGLESSVTVVPDELPGFSNVDFDINIATLFLRAGYPVNDTLKFYGQLGSSNIEIVGTSGGTSISVDDSGSMFGVGVEVAIGSHNNYFDIGYSNNFDKDGVEATSFNIVFVNRF